MPPRQSHIRTPSHISSTSTRLSISIRASNIYRLGLDLGCKNRAFLELGVAADKVLEALQQDNTGSVYVLDPQPYQPIWQPGIDFKLRFEIRRLDRNDPLRYSVLNAWVVRDTVRIFRTEKEVDEDIEHRIIAEDYWSGDALSVGRLQWLFAQIVSYKQMQMEFVPRSSGFTCSVM